MAAATAPVCGPRYGLTVEHMEQAIARLLDERDAAREGEAAMWRGMPAHVTRVRREALREVAADLRDRARVLREFPVVGEAERGRSEAGVVTLESAAQALDQRIAEIGDEA